MDFEKVREYIAKANIVPKAVLKTDKRKKYDAIFFVDKSDELQADDFIIYTFNELDGGKDLRHFTLTLKICCVDPLNIVSLKENLIKLLNFYDRPCDIENIAKLVFSNEGGIYFDENTKCYVNKLFFDCKAF